MYSAGLTEAWMVRRVSMAAVLMSGLEFAEHRVWQMIGKKVLEGPRGNEHRGRGRGGGDRRMMFWKVSLRFSVSNCEGAEWLGEARRTYLVMARKAADRILSFSWRAMRVSCWARRTSGESLMRASSRLAPSAEICLREEGGGGAE
jgi:hypothetical protein